MPKNFSEKIYKEEICEELIEFYTEVTKNEENIEQEMKLQNELEILQRKKEKLLDLALDGFLSKEELANKKMSIEKQIQQIQGKLKELQGKKTNWHNQKQYNQKLKENILNELEIKQDNLEKYIEELLDKIIVIEKNGGVELQIILTGNNVISYGSPEKFKQISQMKKKKMTDFKNSPICRSHAHG